MRTKKQIGPITVVIPCYNSEGTINRAFASVIGQSLLPKQIVLIDDCSVDNTLITLNKIKEKFPSLVAIKSLEKNSGAATARNLGWEISCGEYIAFLDADDVWHPEKLKIQYEFMRLHPEIALCGHDHRIRLSGSGGDWTKSLHSVKCRIVETSEFLRGNQFCTPSVMIKKDIPFRFVDGKRYAEDYLLWLEIALSGLGVGKIGLPLAMTFKKDFGQSGLSANLLRMEFGELDCFYRVYKKKLIGPAKFIWVCIYSTLKFFRRTILTVMTKIAGIFG